MASESRWASPASVVHQVCSPMHTFMSSIHHYTEVGLVALQSEGWLQVYPEDYSREIKGESWKKLLRTLIVAEELVDVFSHYGVDKFLTSSGLTVLPEFRGQNIGARLFEARKPLCQAVGIKASATVFTAIPSQVLAAKCGYELLAELDYADMMNYGIDLRTCDTPTAKLMGMKFCV